MSVLYNFFKDEKGDIYVPYKDKSSEWTVGGMFECYKIPNESVPEYITTSSPMTTTNSYYGDSGLIRTSKRVWQVSSGGVHLDLKQLGAMTSPSRREIQECVKALIEINELPPKEVARLRMMYEVENH